MSQTQRSVDWFAPFNPAGTRISLCMIVRDEAELLPRFLERARGVWDELVIVDTGSRDETVAIAKAAGARVLHREWDHSFAAARNFGLREARGDWILFLDADEFISDALKSEIRAIAGNAAVGAATVVMRNELPHGNVHVSSLLRLFRRFGEAQFRFPVHEEVWSSLEPCLRRSGQRVATLGGMVEHLGYKPERALAKNKKQRDVALLERCLQADPFDLYSWYKLLEVAQFWKDSELLRGTANAFRVLLDKQGVYALAGFPFAGELLVLLSEGLFRCHPEGALAFLLPFGDRISPSASYHLRTGELWEEAGEPIRAAAEFCKCLALDETTRDRQLASTRPLLGLARLALAKGDLWEAWRHTETALRLNPCDREALLSAVVICRQAAGHDGVEDFIRAYEAIHGATLALSSTLAELATNPGWVVRQAAVA